MLDGPDPIQSDVRRHRDYNELAQRFAKAVGGEAGINPILTDFPMPGICSARGATPNTILCGPPGQPVPTYGTRFEGLKVVVERIEATPHCASAA